jgi:glycosyltransferase involved in cell wall biosynthesis
MIAQYHLEERIILHPFTNQIQDYYSKAQVYVLSSRWEGFGLVLVEAMAHGLPIVSSDLPTSLEIMGTFGLYFRNGKTEDLAEKLYEATQIDWETKSKEAITLTQNFTLPHIISQWKNVLLT